MKLKLDVSEIQRSDLITLFADVYETIHFEIPDEFENLIFDSKTYEDAIVDILENGGYVYAMHKNYSSALHNENPKARLAKKPLIKEIYSYDEEDSVVYYPIDMTSVKAGLENEEVIQEVINLAKGNTDCQECYNIMQCIMFGEVYY